MPTHVLFKYGKIGNESKDAAVPHGAFRYIGYNECVGWAIWRKPYRR